MYDEYFHLILYKKEYLGDQITDPNSKRDLTKEKNYVFNALIFFKLLVFLSIKSNILKGFLMEEKDIF